MNPLLRLLSVLLVGGLLSACTTEPPDPGTPDLPDPVVDQLDPLGGGQLLPEPPAANEGIRNRRRMDLDQLQAAISTATGGIYWGMDEGEIKFRSLAQTLGVPDYLDITTEDLSPNMLFQKFLGDAARNVCEQLIDRELQSAGNERIFLVHVAEGDTLESNPDGVEDNLRYLMSRFHSRQVDSGSHLLNPWTWLFESSLHVTNDPPSAWRTVCVGLITHPDFYSY
jgi:hypothetical protein